VKEAQHFFRLPPLSMLPLLGAKSLWLKLLNMLKFWLGVVLVGFFLTGSPCVRADAPAAVQIASIKGTVITIGVLAYNGKAEAVQRWQPTADFLTAQAPGFDFKIVPYYLAEMAAAVRDGRLDFVLTQPLQYVELARQNEIWPLATLNVKTPQGKLDRFGSAIIVRADQPDLHHIRDLRGKVLAGAAPDALGAFLLGLDALNRAGIDPKTEIHTLFTGLPMSLLVQAVADGRTDAAVIRAGYLEQRIAAGLIAPDAFRVLDPKNYADFPYQVTTELVPEWPFCATHRVSAELAQQVARGLLSMSADNPAAIAAGIAHWSLPLDYTSVAQLDTRWLPQNLSVLQWLRSFGVWLLLPLGVVIFVFYRQGRRTQRHLSLQEARLSATLNTLQDAVIVCSADGRVVFANQLTRIFLTHPVDDLSALHGRHYAVLFQLRWRESAPNFDLRQAVALLDKRPEQTYHVQLIIGHQIREVDLQLRQLDVPTQQKNPKFVIILRDVTEYREATALLAYRASHDRLTGLLNHTAFEELLESHRHTSSERTSDGLILWLDVDDFRLINEANSRRLGDQLISRLASALALNAPSSGLVARLGVDEFGIWIPDVRALSYRQWPDELLGLLRELRFEIDGQRFWLTVSIGVCLADYRLGAGLLDDAEAACRRAHREGGNRVVWFSRDDEEIAARRQLMASLHYLKQALDAGNLVQVVQLIAKVSDTQAAVFPLPLPTAHAHYEVLLRVKGADGSLQSPVQFIEAAEKYHFMPEIDRWVIRKTCEFLSQCPQPPLMAINLSGATVQDPQINGFIRSVFREFGINPALICFEITETSAITNFELVLDLMNALRELGCKVALDDFGGGLLSFEFLRRLKPDFVKIDGKLIRDVTQDAVAEVIVTAIVRVAMVMQSQTIGEWVETPAVLDCVRALGVQHIQGYLISSPQLMQSLVDLCPDEDV
jgi:diguanylate cyclase (GGDEF)-like protein